MKESVIFFTFIDFSEEGKSPSQSKKWKGLLESVKADSVHGVSPMERRVSHKIATLEQYHTPIAIGVVKAIEAIFSKMENTTLMKYLMTIQFNRSLK